MILPQPITMSRIGRSTAGLRAVRKASTERIADASDAIADASDAFNESPSMWHGPEPYGTQGAYMPRRRPYEHGSPVGFATSFTTDALSAPPTDAEPIAPGTRMYAAATQPLPWRERVLAEFRSPRNIDYIRSELAKRTSGAQLHFIMKNLDGAVRAFGDEADGVIGDPIAMRGDGRRALDIWAEIRRLNSSFIRSRLQATEQLATYLARDPSRVGIPAGDVQPDDDEDLLTRQFVADELRPPGLERLNAAGGLWNVREDNGPDAEDAALISQGRATRAALEYDESEGRTGLWPSSGGRATSHKVRPGTVGQPTQAWAGDDAPWDPRGNPYRSSAQAIAEYWGEGATSSDDVVRGYVNVEGGVPYELFTPEPGDRQRYTAAPAGPDDPPMYGQHNDPARGPPLDPFRNPSLAVLADVEAGRETVYAARPQTRQGGPPCSACQVTVDPVTRRRTTACRPGIPVGAGISNAVPPPAAAVQARAAMTRRAGRRTEDGPLVGRPPLPAHPRYSGDPRITPLGYAETSQSTVARPTKGQVLDEGDFVRNGGTRVMRIEGFPQWQKIGIRDYDRDIDETLGLGERESTNIVSRSDLDRYRRDGGIWRGRYYGPRDGGPL